MAPAALTAARSASVTEWAKDTTTGMFLEPAATISATVESTTWAPGRPAANEAIGTAASSRPTTRAMDRRRRRTDTSTEKWASGGVRRPARLSLAQPKQPTCPRLRYAGSGGTHRE